ncbi:MAG TPA: ribosomal protein S18-alanine N-acetyltransferase, partial [Actinomycetes bacterium]|nr:ribosomal protein S18-alanine N-acetyltransferase [Actinomycetes bacterium]
VPETRYYVAADEEGSIVGYAGMMSVGAEADVQTIAVHPDLRRSGLGQRLLDDLIERARLRGCTRLFLEVASDNDVAQQLYVQSGFDTIARRSNYYAPGVDALVMRLVIDGRREQ